MVCVNPLLASTLRFLATDTVVPLALPVVVDAVDGATPMPLCGEDKLLPAEVVGASPPNTDSELTTTVSVKFEVVNFWAIASLVEIIVVGVVIESLGVLLRIAGETDEKFVLCLMVFEYEMQLVFTNYWRN